MKRRTMKKQNSIPPNSLYFSLFFFFYRCSCLDRSYESCVPKDCGDVRNITYPFYINGLQDPSCGYPGFNLTCNNNGSSILQISGNDLIVKQIGYEDRTLRLAISPNQTDSSCGSNIRNMTLDPIRFSIDNHTMTTNLVWISNCTENLSADLDKYRVVGSCENRSKEFVMVENDANFRRVKEGCGSSGEIVVSPVELAGGDVVVDGSNYKEVVERGFVMKWSAADCGFCANSGGRCGFDVKDFQFRCFCPDRPHKTRCVPKTKPKILVIYIIVIVIVSVIVIAIAAICIFIRLKKKKLLTPPTENTETETMDINSLESLQYNFSLVKTATNDFYEGNKLGRGGFGAVYKGKLADGQEIAVKRLSRDSGQGT